MASHSLQDMRLLNLTGLDFDLSSSFKGTCDGAIVLLIYGSLLMFNNYLWPKPHPLRNISLWNLRDLDCDQLWWCHWTPYIWFPITA